LLSNTLHQILGTPQVLPTHRVIAYVRDLRAGVEPLADHNRNGGVFARLGQSYVGLGIVDRPLQEQVCIAVRGWVEIGAKPVTGPGGAANREAEKIDDLSESCVPRSHGRY
jgi:hypothetical protein